MFIHATPQETIIDNGRVRIQAAVVQGALDLSVGAAGDAASTILRRVGQNTTAGAWQVEIPESGSMSVDQTANSAALVVSGGVGDAQYSLMLRVTEDSPWIEVSELLCLDRLAQSIKVDWFEAVWQFVDWQEPGEVFSPLLVPEPNDVIGRHVMRSPALIAQSKGRGAALVYSVDSIYRSQALPACMNLLRDGSRPVFRVGLRSHQLRGHVYFTSVHAPASQARFHFSYHLYVGNDLPDGAVLEAASHKLWSAYGTRSLKGAPALPLTYAEYARQIYPRVFELLWAETELDGRRVGAIRSNRSYPDDVWMCPWFSQARSSYGLYLWGQWLGKPDWVERAIATRDLHLAAPQQEGLFPTIFVFGSTPEQCRWIHSHHQGGGPGIYHLMDMSWTAYQLLRWHRDLVPDQRTLEFARRYGRGILMLQREDGGLPAYVDATNRKPVSSVDTPALLADVLAHPGGDRYIPHMLQHAWVSERFVQSSEDAASLLLLAELAHLLPAQDPDRDPFLRAAIRTAGWLEKWVYPEARWIDFETYFSCSPKTLDYYDHRSGQWPQNTLPMHMAAAGMLTLYELSGEARYLRLAERAMSRLTLYQQVWDPPFLNVYGFGGYGVMNTDGEWHDARQAQFADTHLDFYRVTGQAEQLERAKAARQASFITLFLPANSPVYPTGWNRQPQGMAAENHAHGGSDHLCGVSGFDWGAGSALASAAYLQFHRVD